MSRAAHIALALAVAAGAAAADPIEPRVLTAPTAWLPPANAAVATAGVDTRGDGSIGVDAGLVGLAAVELGVDSDARACGSPPCGTGEGQALAAAIHLVRAAFRIGAHQDAWFAGQPALIFGVRETIGGAHAIGEAYVVASRVVGPLRVHAGATALDAGAGTSLRPLAGLEYTPPQVPKTTLIGDVAWEPRFDLAATNLEWVAGIGVRYQAFVWGAIELDYRAREGEDLTGSTVLVRVVGHWPPEVCARRCRRR